MEAALETKKAAYLASVLLSALSAAFIVLKTARDALFLADYSPTLLPYFMMITTLSASFVAVIYLKFFSSRPLSNTVIALLRIFAIGTLLLWIGVKEEIRSFTLVLYIWVGILGALTPVQIWSLISQKLLIRETKRFVGVIGSGGIIGASVGGLFARWIVQVSSVSALLPTATLLILFGLAICHAIKIPTRTETELLRKVESPPTQMRNRFALFLLAVVTLNSIVCTFADFQFKIISQKELVTASSLASFFGTFYATIGAATLVFQLIITPLIMKRVKLSTALMILPMGLAVGNGFVLVFMTLASAVTLIGAEQLFKYSIHRSSLEVIYMAMPETTKQRLKSIIDTVGAGAAEAFSSLLLIALFSLAQLPLIVISALSLILLFFCFIFSALLGREYPKALKTVFQRESANLSSVKAEFLTTDFFRLLPELLQDPDKQRALDLLQLIAEGGNRKLQPYLEPLLKNGDAEVKLRVLELLSAQEGDSSKSVESLVMDPDRRVRIEAIHYICEHPGSKTLQDLVNLTQDSDLTIRAAVCCALLNYGDQNLRALAFENLQRMMSDSDLNTRSTLRSEVAHILEHLRPSELSDALYRSLLQDSSLELRTLALQSLTRNPSPNLIPEILALLSEPVLFSQLRRTMAAYGNSISSNLETLLNSHDQPLEIRKLALNVIADIGDIRAGSILITHASSTNLPLRFTSLKALGRLHRRNALAEPKSKLESLLKQETHSLREELEHFDSFSPKPGGLMEIVLLQRQHWNIQRIFQVLELLYDQKSIHNVYVALQQSNRRPIDAALEYLDSTLTSSHRENLLPLLESKRHKSKRLHNPVDRKKILISFLEAGDELPAAAGVADLTFEELQAWRSDINKMLQASHSMSFVEETWKWRLNMKTTDSLERKLTTVQKIEKFRKVDIFSSLSPDELLLLANHAEEIDFNPGDTIFSEGSSATHFFALTKGTAELWRESRLVTQVKEWESIDILCVLGDEPQMFTAKAKNLCTCLRIERMQLWRILEDYPDSFRDIFRIIIQRQKDSNR